MPLALDGTAHNIRFCRVEDGCAPDFAALCARLGNRRSRSAAPLLGLQLVVAVAVVGGVDG